MNKLDTLCAEMGGSMNECFKSVAEAILDAVAQIRDVLTDPTTWEDIIFDKKIILEASSSRKQWNNYRKMVIYYKKLCKEEK